MRIQVTRAPVRACCEYFEHTHKFWRFQFSISVAEMLPRSAASVFGGVRHFSVGKPQLTISGKVTFDRTTIAHEVKQIIKWVKPHKLEVWDPQRSCDLKNFPKVDPDWLQLEYRPFASIINELPPEKRKLFTVGLGCRRNAVEVVMEDTLDSIRRHKYDKESYEYRIAKLTVQVRNLQNMLQTNVIARRNGFTRKATKEMTDKRKQYLNRLKNLDYKRFEWVIHSLSILYKPGALPSDQVTRQKSYRRLTDIYCNAIKKSKMDAYKAELESQKMPFLEEKLAVLQQIKNDEESMKIPSSVDEDIAKTIKQLENLQKANIVLEPVPDDQKLVGSQ